MRSLFRVNLTMQQVKDSPDIDTNRSVSRQMETRVYDYYRWDPYWCGKNLGMNAMAAPLIAPLWSTSRDPGGADAQPIEGGPGLRSIAAVTGYHIHATDGDIGYVEDFLVDDADWKIRYITVDTKNWWSGQRVLISPRSVRQVDWTNKLMHLTVNRQKVKGSPSYDPSIDLPLDFFTNL